MMCHNPRFDLQHKNEFKTVVKLDILHVNEMATAKLR